MSSSPKSKLVREVKVVNQPSALGLSERSTLVKVLDALVELLDVPETSHSLRMLADSSPSKTKRWVIMSLATK